MGAVIDYFRPIQGKSYCEMLESNRLHQWSSNGSNWVTPRYYNNHYGGSAVNYPNDGRTWISFWGDDGGLKGGCCVSSPPSGGSYPSFEGWNKAFKLFYVTGIAHIPNI